MCFLENTTWTLIFRSIFWSTFGKQRSITMYKYNLKLLCITFSSQNTFFSYKTLCSLALTNIRATTYLLTGAPNEDSKNVREKSRECPNHKRQPFPDTKRKRKQTKPNKRKTNTRTKSTKISCLFPKRDNCNAKKTEKHKNNITQGKT